MGRPIVMTNMRSTSSCFVFSGIPVQPRPNTRFEEGARPQRRNRMAQDSWLARRVVEEEANEAVTPPEPVVQPIVQAAPLRWSSQECELCHDTCWMMGAADGQPSRCGSCSANPGRVRQCTVCFEDQCMVDVNHCCDGGDICKRCISQHCAVQLQDGAQACTCPMPGCNHTLDFKVIGSLHDSKNLKRMLEINSFRQVRETRLAHYEEAPEMLEWAADRAQLCPFCYTIVEKRAGCNHMTCNCKKEFWYCCGIPYRTTIPGVCSEGHQHHANCRGEGSGDVRPILNPNVGALKELQKRQHERCMAFASGTHERLGAASQVRMLPVEIVQKIVAGVKNSS